MKLLVQVVFAGLWAGAAQAQALSYTPFTIAPGTGPLAGGPPLSGPVDLTRAYVGVSEYNNTVIGSPNLRNGDGLVSVADLLAASGGTGTSPALSYSLVGIAARLDRLTDRFREGIALAGSINVLPPNPGDRFAVSFGGAGYDGAGAGSVAFSARLDESTLAYVGVARGPTQTLVKGGVGLSFR
ncbi:hypothetical protein M2440_002923 [Methylorubrum extorquens]|uniref:YadA-like family protein n=1 Tax=Methylorubrum extorquens TaxID=408 RepID=UPI0020A2226A|nr:YadA-like family protein [Methylorubrum extorquens]MCP1558593.1 hypothetical protein [Methylorubrum extorquens]MDF9792222.1 hypothetical protein [Methylorubrum extorquens]MDH6666685.1 hypothetical protein [Methylorubrum zatmanii]